MSSERGEQTVRWTSRLGGVCLLALAALLGVAGAVVGFLAAALVTARVPLLVVSGLALCFGITAGLGWLGWRVLRRKRPGRLALGLGAVAVLLVAAVSAFTVFAPLVPTSEMQSPDVPREVTFWELPTGSLVAIRRVAAAPAILGRPPVIYVHGGPGAGVVAVEALVEAFSFPTASGHEVLFYDQVGGGLSERLGDVTEYTSERHVADLEAIRERLGAERVVLAGESWGAELATLYLAVHPERVERLVLISPGVLHPANWVGREPCDLVGRAPDEVRAEFDSYLGARLWTAALLLEVNPSAARAFLPDAECDEVIRRMLSLVLPGGVCDPASLPEGEDFAFGMWGNLMLDQEDPATRNGLREVLARLETPVLVLRGECDYCLPGVAAEYLAAFPNAQLLEVEEAGHFLWLEKPEVLAEAVGSFLGEAP